MNNPANLVQVAAAGHGNLGHYHSLEYHQYPGFEITDACPVQVRGMGAGLSNEISTEMIDYGHFQVLFADGSVRWYKAGWGPMISDTAFFVESIISPTGCVNFIMDEVAKSDDIGTSIRTSRTRIHSSETEQDGEFAGPDSFLSMHDDPDRRELNELGRAYLPNAKRDDIDLERRMLDAVQPPRICPAADENIRTGHELEL